MALDNISEPQFEKQFRVKVYKLNEEGTWDDEGTGYVVCDSPNGTSDGASLKVWAEEDHSQMLLSSVISEEDIYQRQQDTLIVWNEPVDEIDLALSFQDPVGCNDLWEEICGIQSEKRKSLGYELFYSDKFEIGGIGDFDTSSIDLPQANLFNIYEIKDVFEDAIASPYAKRLYAKKIKEEYLDELIKLANMVIDLEDKSSLEHMFWVFSNIFLLNDIELIETMISEPYCNTVLKILENDPGIINGKIPHYKVVTEQVNFKEVYPYNDEELVKTIRIAYLSHYIKDVVLARLLDDQTFATIRQLIYLKNKEILRKISGNDEFLSGLVEHMRTTTDSEKILDQLKFLKELLDLTKQFGADQSNLHKKFIDKGIFSVLESTLSNEDSQILINSIGVLLCIVDHYPSDFRDHLLGNNNPLLDIIINNIINHQDTGIIILYFDLLEKILDEDTFGLDELQQEGGSEFVKLFFKDYLKKLLVDPLSKEIPDGGVHSHAESILKSKLLEFSSFLLGHHIEKMIEYILNNNIIGIILSQLKCKEKCIMIDALTAIKNIISLQISTTHLLIVEKDHFDPIIVTFLKNGDKYNLLNSSILDLFHFIGKEKMETLIKYFINKHYDRVKDHDFDNTFSEINDIYINMTTATNKKSVFDIHREKTIMEYYEKQQEENWFDEDDEDYEVENHSRKRKREEDFEPRVKRRKTNDEDD
eukprot:TRINITY_DN7970_c0_g1_i1.p1 TRINITY_DN7970_c0_g1~~TRINITY_DN7970_c0_g1_i1.p1  ORF type:complete len:703 (-),score=164.01 TRINITY_DN7970_c0_g1_i1:78-2186(-)